METPFDPGMGLPYVRVGVAAAVIVATGWLQTWIARRHLRTPATPSRPIVEWELAGSKGRLDAILASWDGGRRDKAALTLVIDVPFLVAYGFGLSLAASMGAATFASYGWDTVACAFAIVAWASVTAAGLDLVENLALAWTLGPALAGDSLPRAIAALAKAKFTMVKIGIPVGVAALTLNALGCRTDCL